MKRKRVSSARKIRRIIFTIAIIYVLMIAVVVGFLSYTIMKRCEGYMMSETSSLIAANSRQLELNINAYLEKIEKNVALMFSDEDYYLYDATNSRIDEYDKIQYEADISNRIIDLGLMENYADFCIVYSNDHTVGWVSKTTENMYAEKSMYEDLSSYISDDKAMDAWCVGVCDTYNRMYYVKRLNKNAILVASFYSNELDTVFEYPDELKGMTIRLVNDEGQIIFSSQKDEIAGYVSDEQKKYLQADVTTSAILEDELMDINVCENGWVVMCTVSVDEVMDDFYALRQFVSIVAISVGIVSVLVCILVMVIVSRPMGGIVQNLYQKASFDELSGVMNKTSFESSAKDLLKIYPEKHFALMMLDMDNFKQINDTLGHAYGDQVIRRLGTLLRNNFHSDSIMVGRMGGDEFAILYFFNAEGENVEELEKKKTRNRINYLMDEFALEFAKEKEKINVSLSIGMASTYEVEKEFDALYKAADEALYLSKNNGKNRYTFYTKKDKEVAENE